MQKIAKRDAHLPEELPQEVTEEIVAFRTVLEGKQPLLTPSLREVVSYAKPGITNTDSRSNEKLLAAAEEFLKASKCGLKNCTISFLKRGGVHPGKCISQKKSSLP